MTTTPSRRRAAAAALATGSALLLAACGSQLDAADVAAANGSTGVLSITSGSSETALEASVGTDENADVAEDLLGPTDTTGGDGGPAPTDAGTSATPATSDDAPGETPDEPAAPATGDAGGGSEAASCDGFDNDQPGVTSSTITLANASDVSGPVPGIFESARQGSRAYVAYFNATQKLCGHDIKLLELDSRADAGADQQAYARACAETFAAVGSMSAFDSGGAKTAQECGLPDVRSTTVNPERVKCSTCFSAQSVNPGQIPRAMPTYFLDQFSAQTKKVALLYINAGAAPVNAASFKKGWESVGWSIPYFQAIDVAEFNFAPYVQQMKDRGIEIVYYLGPYQNTIKVQQAMKQQGFTPDVYLQDSTIYDQKYVEQAGELAEGAYAYSNVGLFTDSGNKEMALYRAWLEQTNPGADPNFYGLYAWSATRLFLEQATQLGGDLDRASMVQALGKVKDWTSNGLHSPQDVGGKTTGKCQKIIRYTGGTWKQVSKGDYLCDTLVNTGVGA
ncbi:ABC transporter substrate-binding protein [Nocardioides sp.]|uniref:ABC transporter substrate-binding protein n=1 Tax=Nocardioides sp. TaxID=35761 RepID=UPI0026097652|nr:ABC transporter substrate-binding protein [Nocardioides sp.]